MNRLSYYTKLTFQLLSYLVLKFIVLRPTPQLKHFDFAKAQPYVMVANHPHSMDPFHITTTLRVADFVRLAPFALMTANKFYDPLWVRPFAWLIGCFPAHGPHILHGVSGAQTYIKHGYTLVMFPEGRRTSTPLPPKHGIGSILQAAPKAHVILVHVARHKNGKVKFVRIAQPSDAPRTPEALMESIYQL